jgi:hypothetical protein
MENHALPHVLPRQLDRNRMSPVPPPDPTWKHTLHVLEMLGAIRCGVAEPHNRDEEAAPHQPRTRQRALKKRTTERCLIAGRAKYILLLYIPEIPFTVPYFMDIAIFSTSRPDRLIKIY